MALTKIGKEGITGISNSSDATAITITSGENVGIGETASANLLHVKASDTGIAPHASAQIVLEREGTNYLQFLTAENGTSGCLFGDGSDVDVGKISYDHNTTTMSFQTETADRMRINGSGVVSIGGSTATAKLNVIGAGGSNVQIQNNINSGTNTIVSIGFINDNGLIGSIQCGGSSTSYATSSDYRMKENVDYTWDATTRIKQLKPARFNFIADDTNTLVDGFIAHEVSSIVPEAVTGAKDAMAVKTRYTADDVETQGDTPSKNVGDPKTYSSSKIDSQGIDQSKLVPLLVKTIQELEARITALEAE